MSEFCFSWFVLSIDVPSLWKIIASGQNRIQNEDEKKIIATHENLERICLTKQRREWGSNFGLREAQTAKNYVRMQT
jgi:hypothetical protein